MKIAQIETQLLEQAMFRSQMPKVNELRDLIADPTNPSAYFQNFDDSLRNCPLKMQTWLAREREFARLDNTAWNSLKNEAYQYLTKYTANGRAWEQLISILNQARAYNYLNDIGCSEVRFVERVKKKKTPDLEANLRGRKVLCEVKTIYPSAKKLAIRQAGDADSTKDFLDDKFLEKLSSTILVARSQMLAYDENADVKRIVFIGITFDDPYGEYDANYFSQIDQHLDSPTYGGLDIVFYNQRTAFQPQISMRHAHVINE